MVVDILCWWYQWTYHILWWYSIKFDIECISPCHPLWGPCVHKISPQLGGVAALMDRLHCPALQMPAVQHPAPQVWHGLKLSRCVLTTMSSVKPSPEHHSMVWQHCGSYSRPKWRRNPSQRAWLRWISLHTVGYAAVTFWFQHSACLNLTAEGLDQLYELSSELLHLLKKNMTDMTGWPKG